MWAEGTRAGTGCSLHRSGLSRSWLDCWGCLPWCCPPGSKEMLRCCQLLKDLLGWAVVDCCSHGRKGSQVQPASPCGQGPLETLRAWAAINLMVTQKRQV